MIRAILLPPRLLLSSLEAMMFCRCPGWFVLLLTLLLGVLPASTSLALNLQIEGPNTGGVIDLNGVEFASNGGSITFEISIFEGQMGLEGYDVSIGWDPNEVDLVSALQLAPDTGTPVPFNPSPVGGLPTGSRAAALLGLAVVPTTLLFSVTFDVLIPITDDQPDVFVFLAEANGSGISPDSLSIDNPGGAGFDITLPEPGSAVVLMAGCLLLTSLRRRR